jgi:hypothetical protein
MFVLISICLVIMKSSADLTRNFPIPCLPYIAGTETAPNLPIILFYIYK